MGLETEHRGENGDLFRVGKKTARRDGGNAFL